MSAAWPANADPHGTIEQVDTKTCRGCRCDLPLSEFYRRAGDRDGYRSRCKACMYAARGPRRRPLTAEERRRGIASALLKHRYGITLDEYEAMLAAQGGVCADCGAPPGATRLHVDHDHACCPTAAKSCGRCIRGLVCFACNLARG